jgi:hypothetical protein
MTFYNTGTYKSYIHINFHGSFPLPDLRSLISIPDSNGFVTMFIDYFLLEAQSLGTPSPLCEPACASAFS